MSLERRAILKGLRQIKDVGLQRIIKHNGAMLLDGSIYNTIKKKG